MNRNLYATVVAIIIVVITVNIVWADYVHSEATVYDWDFDGFWARSCEAQRLLFTDPVRFVKYTLRSIRSSEYTWEPILPTAILISYGDKLHLFGCSRAAYILGNGNLLLIPALLLLAWLISGLRRTQVTFSFLTIKGNEWLATALVALVTPTLWLPLYRGYPDVGGLMFCFLVTALFFRWRQSWNSTAYDLQTWLKIVILLVGLTFFRRWYLYWIFWFWVASMAVCLWDAFVEHRSRSLYTITARKLRQILGVAIIYGAAVFVVSPDFVGRIFTYDYADAYSAFRHTRSLGDYYRATIGVFGVVGLLMFFSGLVYALRVRGLRTLGVFLCIQFVGILIHFGRTQDFGIQHNYLLLATMLPLSTMFVAELLQRFRWAPAVLLASIGVLAYKLSFTTALHSVPSFLWPLVGAVDGGPIRRGDLAEWRRLTATLDDLQRWNGEGRVYVLASGPKINCSALASVNRSLNEKFVTPNLVDYGSDVDKRDGFPSALLTARYVIVAVPIQFDFDPADQQVIFLPAREMLLGSGIGRAFRKLPQRFILDGGVEVYIYEKLRAFNPEEVQQLSTELRKVYPDRPYIYETSRNVR